ncbi:MAG: endolytic transglycosylase MltG [Chitinophagia bacterium]|nr:endolytic transglycosylase MltG [Chitinophagia bacterium]NDD15987.1 endolytic transglycosylase MltG [Chitinophagia bacterium]
MKYLYLMKKWILIALLVLVTYSSYTLFIKVTHFTTEKESFEYKAGGLNALADSLSNKKIIRDKTSFLIFAKFLNVEDRIKPGKFLIVKNTSLINLIRILRNNQQARVKFILNKVRTKGDLAKLVASTFSIDSIDCIQYLNNNDSLAPFGTDTTQVLSLFIPNTYEFYWSTPMPKLLQKMKTEESLFWSKNNRLAKAASIGLTKNEVYTLASIVEEETNYDSDKTIIASVYQNRLKKKMPLQACPTIKYAMQDFTLTRIYEKYLSNPSPYNTYKKAGLPPGPICTPAPKTIDLVLNAPITNYFYFVAKADFSGYHHFSATYEEHSKFAKEYQLKLDEYQAKKNK